MGSSINYLATFASGFQDAVARALKADGARVIKVMDGAVEYSIGSKPDRDYFSNIFAVLFSTKSTRRAEDIAVRALSTDAWADTLENRLKGARTFRVIGSDKGKSVPLKRESVERFEREIAMSLGITPARAGAQAELWLMRREDGMGYLLHRINRKRSQPRPEELKPDLTAMLCMIAGDMRGKSALDPFCGKGTLARAMAEAGAVVTATDIDPRTRGLTVRGVTAFCMDARDMKRFKSGNFDFVVTDPPWGAVDSEIDVPALYKASFYEIARMLKKGGIAVMLTASRDAALAAAKGLPMALDEDYQVMVNGRKACVLKYRRT